MTSPSLVRCDLHLFISFRKTTEFEETGTISGGSLTLKDKRMRPYLYYRSERLSSRFLIMPLFPSGILGN